MTFTLSGSVITQAGTDADLSGLAAITGVVVTDSTGVRKIYDLNIASLKLVVTGSLAFDPDYETLLLRKVGSRGLTVNGGTVTIGQERTLTVGGKTFTLYSQGDAIICPYIGGSGQFDPEGIVFQNGGRLEWNGGTIYSSCAMGAVVDDTTPTALINSGTFVTTGPNSGFGAGANAMFFRNDGAATNVVVKSIKLDSRRPDLNGAIVYARNGATEMSFDMRAGFIQLRNGTTTGALMLNGLRLADNAFSFDIEGNGIGSNSQGCVVTNVDIGTGWRISSNLDSNEITNLSIFQTLGFSISDPSGDPIQGAVVRIPTVDGGNRTNVLVNTQLQHDLDFESGAFDLYTHTSGADGAVGSFDVLTGRHFSTGGTAGLKVDLYSQSQVVGADDFVIQYASYGHDLASEVAVLHSPEPIEIERVLIPDTLVSEPDKATVIAYTSIDTAAQFYDRAKAWLVDHYAGEAETLVTRAGDTIDAGSYGVVIDATADNAFAFNGSTITVKSTRFAGSLTTTGTVTLAGGAEVAGVIIDANRDFTLTEASGRPFTIYTSEADREARTNAVAENVTAFNGLAATYPHLWAVVDFEGYGYVKRDLAITQGANTIDVSVAGQIMGVSQQVATGLEITTAIRAEQVAVNSL